MVKEYQYTNIRRVLDNLLDHPLLRDLTLEQVVRHTIRFIGLFGFSKMYQDKIIEVEIHKFKGLLPCDLISIVQVRDKATKICLRAMTDSFNPGLIAPPPAPPTPPAPPSVYPPHHKHKKRPPIESLYLPETRRFCSEPAFKTQGRIIYTSFPEGCVEIAYKSIPVDEDGFPLLIDNENYLAALEAYIKKQVFTVKFDTGKLAMNVLNNAQQEYAMLAGELQGEFLTPSFSEAEAYTRYYNTLIPKMREFDNGFKHLGDREWLRRH